MAEEQGVSVRTLYRDVQTLIGLGAPIEGEAGIGKTALTLAFAGMGDGLNAGLAWAYVGLRIVHSYDTAHRVQTMVKGGEGQFRPVLHPLIVVHPESDRPALNIAPATATSLEGLPGDEGAELLEWLLDFSTREEEAYVHQWEPGDVALWDNFGTTHYGVSADIGTQLRRLYRVASWSEKIAPEPYMALAAE